MLYFWAFPRGLMDRSGRDLVRISTTFCSLGSAVGLNRYPSFIPLGASFYCILRTYMMVIVAILNIGHRAYTSIAAPGTAVSSYFKKRWLSSFPNKLL